MTAVLSEAIRAARLQVIATAIDGGTLTLYTGARPAFGTVAGLSPQCVIGLQSPAASVVGATLTFATVIEGVRTAGASITWARFATGANDPVMDCDVGTKASGIGDILIDNPVGFVGGFVQITAGTISE